jgi:hypothetical protein
MLSPAIRQYPFRLLLGRMIQSKIDAAGLDALNAVRARVGAPAVRTVGELPVRAPLLLYFTAEALEYPRGAWPPNFRFAGAATWAPPAKAPEWLDELDRPTALVTCSTERQQDRAIVETALRTLPEQGYFVVATTAAHAIDSMAGASNPHVHIEEFLPHDPVIERAGVVVCHGGMGITQRALSGACRWSWCRSAAISPRSLEGSSTQAPACASIRRTSTNGLLRLRLSERRRCTTGLPRSQRRSRRPAATPPPQTRSVNYSPGSPR